MMSNNIKKNFLWNAFGNIVYLGCQWFITILIARLSGYEDAGVLSLAMSISATFQSLALFGIRNFQVSDISCKYSDTCYVGLRNYTCFLALVLCMLFAAANNYSFDIVIATFWFMIFRLSENYSDVLHGIFQKNERLYLAGRSLFIKGILLLVGFVVGFYALGTLNGGLGIMALMAVCVTFLIDFPLAKRLSDFDPYDNFGNCICLAKETLPLCIYMFLNSIIATAPKYILEKMCDEELLGVYSSIFAPALLIQAAAQYIYMPFISRFALMYEKKDITGFNSLSKKILTIILGIGGAVLAVSVPLGKFGLQFLFGETITEYVELLYLIIVGAFCTAINAFYQSLAIVLREMKQLVISCAVGIIVCCIVSVIAIRGISADGASIRLISGTAVSTIILYVNIDRNLKKFNMEE